MTPEAEAHLQAEIERQKYYARYGHFPAQDEQSAHNGHVQPAPPPTAERNGYHHAVEHAEESEPPPDDGQVDARTAATPGDGTAERNGQADAETAAAEIHLTDLGNAQCTSSRSTARTCDTVTR